MKNKIKYRIAYAIEFYSYKTIYILIQQLFANASQIDFVLYTWWWRVGGARGIPAPERFQAKAPNQGWFQVWKSNDVTTVPLQSLQRPQRQEGERPVL